VSNNKQSILILCNPISGQGDKSWLEQFKEQLTTLGHQVRRYDTISAGDAERFLRDEDWKADIIAIAGGDGTINEAINGLSQDQLQQSKILVLATGTANVLGRELGVHKWANKRGLSKLCDLIGQCSAEQNDHVTAIKNSPLQALALSTINKRRMLLMSGIGFDAWVVKTVSSDLKKRIGKLAYVVAMFKQLPNFGKQRYRVVADGVVNHCSAAIISNGRLYAGSFVLAPKAKLEDPQLVLTLLKSSSPWSLALSLLGMAFGLADRVPGVDQFSCSHITLEAIGDNANSPAEPMQIDGDDCSTLPAEVSCSTQNAYFLSAKQ